jgi:hypothetical protein
MAAGRGTQIEKHMDRKMRPRRGCIGHSHSIYKKIKHRRERRRAKVDPECTPEYNRYDGWEW